jgi:GxxExxY protein
MATLQGDKLAEEARTRSIIGAFYEVYNTLGYGFSESVYLAALEWELIRRGHKVAREVSICIWYKGHPIAWQRIDMLVDDVIIVEGKATPKLRSDASQQCYHYLRASNLEVGRVLGFGHEPEFFRLYCPKASRDGDA